MVSEPLLAGISSNTTVTRPDGSHVDLYFNRVDPNFFATMGIPIVEGRSLVPGDREGAPQVVILNEAGGRLLFGAASPVGRHFELFGQDVEVAGVAHDSKYDSVRNEGRPTAFQPYAQASQFPPRGMHILVRTTIAPAPILGAIRAAAAEIDRDVPV